MLTTRSGLNFFISVFLSAATGCVLAAGAGQIQHLSGTLHVQRTDGSVRILSQKSEVNPGDTLTTQVDSYAQINFTDGSSVTMRPNTQMKLDSYQFVQDKPQEDSAFFRLLKGGLRTVTGLVGKRGNQDAYRIGTATATIGIRGSGGETIDTSNGCEGVVAGCDKADKGVYHTAFTGSYKMYNDGGSQDVNEGETAYAKDSKTKPEKKDNPFDYARDLAAVLAAGKDCAVR